MFDAFVWLLFVIWLLLLVAWILGPQLNGNRRYTSISPRKRQTVNPLRTNKKKEIKKIETEQNVQKDNKNIKLDDYLNTK